MNTNLFLRAPRYNHAIIFPETLFPAIEVSMVGLSEAYMQTVKV